MFDFVPRDLIDEREVDSIRGKISSVIATVRTARLPLPPDLFHYTDAGGLKGIVESGVLRATHVGFMNDASEYLHAVQLLDTEIKKVKQTAINCAHQELLEVIEPAVAPRDHQGVAPCFVACFSSKGNSLNQWRAYGKGEGGYSIGFDLLALDRAAVRQGILLCPAIYDEVDQVGIVHDLLQWALVEYARLAPNYIGAERAKHCKVWAHWMLWVTAGIAPTMKNSAFKEEHEWRLIKVALPAPWPGGDQIEFIPKPTGLVPYIELKAGSAPQPGQPDMLPISRLWSGPGRAKDISLLSGRALLEKHQYHGVPFEASAIPFRVG